MHRCGQTLTTPAPHGTTLDFGIQEFVKLHAHNGQFDAPKFEPVKPIPMTLDFKPVTLADGPTNVEGKIDEKPASAAKIIDAVDKISKEYAEKMLDSNVIKKIEELQAADKTTGWVQLPVPVGKHMKTTMFPPPSSEWGDAEVAALEKKLAEKKAIENALKIKLLQQELDNLAGKQIVNHSVPAPKHEAPLVFPEERKFR